MRDSLEKRYQNRELSDDEIKKYKIQVIIKKLILEAVYIFMIVFSFVRINKNAVFYSILGEGNFFSFYGVALVIFFVTMYGMFLFNTSVLLYILYKAIAKDNYLELVHVVNTKGDIWTFICKCLSMLLFILVYITTPCTVVGTSMGEIIKNPDTGEVEVIGTLFDGDKLLCVDIFYTPSKGDIIVFDAKNYDTRHEQCFYIKRVLGVEGTSMVYDPINAVVFIDGEECHDIKYDQFVILKADAEEGIPESETVLNSFVIPENKLLCLGDNRDKSQDSRKFGLVDVKDVLGKVYFRMFPLNGIRFF